MSSLGHSSVTSELVSAITREESARCHSAVQSKSWRNQYHRVLPLVRPQPEDKLYIGPENKQLATSFCGDSSINKLYSLRCSPSAPVLTAAVTKMLVQALTATLLVCSTWATTTPRSMMTTEVVPTKPCCIPKRWQAAMFDLKAGPNALMYATIFAYDADMKREGYMVLPIDGGPPIHQGFTDYSKGIKYEVTYGPSGGCTQNKPEHDFYDHCFATNSTTEKVTNLNYVGMATLGGEGKGIVYDAWTFKLGAMDISLSLGRDGCIPILENVRNNDPNMPSDILLMFNDVTTTVTDTHLLETPAACVAAAGGGFIG
ncbi:hypothetical protein RRG08_032316 [Elysia crispata]|uniref:Uncharacterized protein n=1 Tax=Elysia crispata TaxID=231223 RepID=A0AAE1ARX8_9GAST|nr:hypothetical protein RRG08_032316 [Elysia crispata]